MMQMTKRNSENRVSRIFRIGDFTFQMSYPSEITPPDNFMLFECRKRSCVDGSCREADEMGSGSEQTREETDGTISGDVIEYSYYLEVAEELPAPEGKIVAQRLDLTAFSDGDRESRLIGVKGVEGYYACYQELSGDHAKITLSRDRIEGLHIDPVFTSLLALERRLVARDNMVLHCAYVEYEGEAILFSAPSETGKTTQAGLWEKYRGSRTVNGDRALLAKRNGRWAALGWPVCGTSEVCNNETFPIRAIVMLSQAEENLAVRMTPGQAFPLLYSQITVNKWNTEAHIHTMDLIEALIAEVPVYHLGCTISEEAVDCLDAALQNKGTILQNMDA